MLFENDAFWLLKLRQQKMPFSSPAVTMPVNFSAMNMRQMRRVPKEYRIV